ncbi:MAG: hypothetical protein GY839_14205 [candidate division Zixibacteria bacterium]|nr:hypothetical protein [candidate division Zixibacteria bacterium]
MTKLTVLTSLMIVAIAASIGFCQALGDDDMNMLPSKDKIVFATFVESAEQIDHIRYLAESIRKFGGQVKDAPIWLYVGDYAAIDIDEIKQTFEPLGVEIYTSGAPEGALWFYYAGKTFAAGVAEKMAEGLAEILVWLDDDTIFLQEPSDFLLAPEISFAYRPVMHNRSGTLYGKKPTPFWGRIYDKLVIKSESLFEMTTPADNQKINAYFNAGLIAVRPEKGILRKWGEDFTVLYQDKVLADMCKADLNMRIFLHQTALVGAVLNTLGRDDMIELGDDYNYPLFFQQMFGADREFGSIDNVTSLRYDIYFRDPDPQWDQKIKGPKEKVDWIKARLGK